MRSEQLTPHLIRVVLGGEGFDTFIPNEFTDAYVKIVFANCIVGQSLQRRADRWYRRLIAGEQVPVGRGVRRVGAVGARQIGRGNLVR